MTSINFQYTIKDKKVKRGKEKFNNPLRLRKTSNWEPKVGLVGGFTVETSTLSVTYKRPKNKLQTEPKQEIRVNGIQFPLLSRPETYKTLPLSRTKGSRMTGPHR